MHPDIATRYLALARDLAQRHSRDRSTQVGAYLVHPVTLAERARGYNGLPRGARDSLPERHERPLKYDYFEHAETNALYNRVRAQLKGSLCLTTRVPTMGDLRAAISVGAQALYCPYPAPGELDDAAQARFARGLALAAECGTAVRRIEAASVRESEPRRARKLGVLFAHERLRGELLARGAPAASAVFVAPDDFTVLASGEAGLPRGLAHSVTHASATPHALWVESPVRAAVFNLARESLAGSSAVVTLLPCAECARALAASGIAEVFAPVPDAHQLQRWGESFAVSRQLLAELGVRLVELDAGRAPSCPH
jgi:deoxycytidylate deaminase